MKILRFVSLAEAEARSRAGWEAVLGRPRDPADTTEFLWEAVEVEGGAALVIGDDTLEQLTAEEIARLEELPDPPPEI